MRKFTWLSLILLFVVAMSCDKSDDIDFTEGIIDEVVTPSEGEEGETGDSETEDPDNDGEEEPGDDEDPEGEGDESGDNEENPGEEEQPGEEPNEDPSEQPGQDPTDQPNEDPTDQPTQDPTDQPTQDPTDNPNNQPDDPNQGNTQQPGDNNTDQPGDNKDDQVTTPPEIPDDPVEEDPKESDTTEPKEPFRIENGKVISQNGKPTIIMFRKTWCSYADKSQPTFEAVAAEYGSKINFAVLNWESSLDNRFASEYYGVKGSPNVVFINPDGSQKGAIFHNSGMPKSDYVWFIKKYFPEFL